MVFSIRRLLGLGFTSAVLAISNPVWGQHPESMPKLPPPSAQEEAKAPDIAPVPDAWQPFKEPVHSPETLPLKTPAPATPASELPPVPHREGIAECQKGTAPYQAAFQKVPQSQLINGAEPASNSSGSSLTKETPTSEQTSQAPLVVQAQFADPAHFSWSGFSASGNSLVRNLVVVYEGMTLSVYPDGQYKVRFVAEVPDMPVTMRLQFRVQRKNCAAGTITLPPITFSTKSNAPLHSVSRSWTVEHKGYSTLLTGLCSDCAGCRITRDGTARFGTLPAQANEMILPPNLYQGGESRPSYYRKRFCNQQIFPD